MSEGVVDSFEGVNVDEVDRNRTSGSHRVGERLIEPVEEQRAVGESGQRIVQRPMGEQVLGRPEVFGSGGRKQFR